MDYNEPNVFLNDEINNNKEKLRQLKTTYNKKGLISFVALLAAAGVSACAIPFSLPICLGAATIAIQLVIYKYELDKKHSASENSLIQQNTHLKRLCDKGLEINNKLHDKRKSKILALGEAYKNNAGKYYGVEIVGSVVKGFTLGTVALTLFNPTAAWASLVFLLADAAWTKAEINLHERQEELGNRISNLDRDLALTYLITDENEKVYSMQENEKTATKSNVKITKSDFEKENSYFVECLNEIQKENNKVLKKVR